MNGNSPRLLELSNVNGISAVDPDMSAENTVYHDCDVDGYGEQITYRTPRIKNPRMSMATMKNFDPLLQTPQSVDGRFSEGEPSPLISMAMNNRSPKQQLSEAIVEAVKNQEFQFHDQLHQKNEEIEDLKNQLATAHDIIRTMSAALEETVDVATTAIEREKEDMKKKLQSMFFN